MYRNDEECDDKQQSTVATQNGGQFIQTAAIGVGVVVLGRRRTRSMGGGSRSMGRRIHMHGEEDHKHGEEDP